MSSIYLIVRILFDKFIMFTVTLQHLSEVNECNPFTDAITEAPKVQVSCPESFRKSVSEQGINCGTSTHQNTIFTYGAVLPLKDGARTVVVDGNNQDIVMAEGNRVRKIKALQTAFNLILRFQLGN